MDVSPEQKVDWQPVCPSKAPRDDNDDDAIEFRCRCPPLSPLSKIQLAAGLTKQEPVRPSGADGVRGPTGSLLLRRRRGTVWRGGGLRTFLFKPDISGGGRGGCCLGKKMPPRPQLCLLHAGIIRPAMPSLPSERRRLAN